MPFRSKIIALFVHGYSIDEIVDKLNLEKSYVEDIVSTLDLDLWCSSID
jgi:hypothetical protein